ncbi:MAG: phosphate ABC transporter permease PstA [Zetaproteobacteria bacterium]|nr:phosphate ABC transporter permease PstA [Zetaproteobacteria bacterium]
MKRRWCKDVLFRWVCGAVSMFATALLLVLLVHLCRQGWEYLDSSFLTQFASRRPAQAGIKAGLWGTLWLLALTATMAFPLGVATALYLEEYAPQGRLTRLLEVNIANLAGVPSIIYGLLGLAIFVRLLGLERSLWSGSMTLTLLILPVIIVSAQGAIRSVPRSLREASYALGAQPWHVNLLVVFPAALPGILTGVILALSRAIGETAPLVIVGAVGYMRFVPTSPSDDFTALPLQIYDWASRPQVEFHQVAASGILVLLSILLMFNLTAVWIRHRLQRYPS